MSQIVSLIELSDLCEQSLHYESALTPLLNEDDLFAFWDDRDGEKNIYHPGKPLLTTKTLCMLIT